MQAWANKPKDYHPEATTGQTTVKTRLSTIVRLALDKPTLAIKRYDRLADIGLDSLKRLVVVSLIEEQMGIAIAESQLSAQTSLKQLRDLVEQGSPAETPSDTAVLAIQPTAETYRQRLTGNGGTRLYSASGYDSIPKAGQNIKELNCTSTIYL